jgi:uncharacterized protein YndB with AHSA1/START domain
MMRIGSEIEIARPPEAVFPWIADPGKAMQWQGDVEGGEIIESTPEVVGTTFTETVAEGGSRLVMRGTITEHEPNRVMGFHLESSLHAFDVRYALEGTGESTRMSMQTAISWKFPMTILSLVIGKKMEESLRGKMDDELRELKRLCEAE